VAFVMESDPRSRPSGLAAVHFCRAWQIYDKSEISELK